MNSTYSVICVMALMLFNCTDKNVEVIPDCSTDAVKLIVVEKLNPSDCTLADGKIIVTASGGRGPYEYKTDHTFTTNGNFMDLEAGVHQIIGRDLSGCSDTLSVELIAPQSIYLSWATHLKPVFTTRCAKPGCHVGGGRGDFSRYSEVKEYLSNIRHRVITRSMPQDIPLEKDQIRMIICWIDAGTNEF